MIVYKNMFWYTDNMLSALKYSLKVLLKQQIGSGHLFGQQCNRHTFVKRIVYFILKFVSVKI